MCFENHTVFHNRNLSCGSCTPLKKELMPGVLASLYFFIPMPELIGAAGVTSCALGEELLKNPSKLLQTLSELCLLSQARQIICLALCELYCK